MGLETGSYIEDLNTLWPLGSDPFSQGDDHLRLIKTVLTNQFTALGAGAVTVTADQLNGLVTYGTGTGLTADLNFSDNDKGVSWDLPSALSVKITADEDTIDSIDYEYIKITAAGVVINADDAAQDSGFVACMVDQTGSPSKYAAIGFNDVTTREFYGGVLYNVSSDELWLGDNDPGVTAPLTDVVIARSATVKVSLNDLYDIVEGLRGGAVGETMTLTKDSGDDFDFTATWA